MNISSESLLDSLAPDGIEANGGSIIWNDEIQNIYNYFKKSFTGDKKLTFNIGSLNVFSGEDWAGNNWINNSALTGLEITKAGQGTPIMAWGR